MTAVAADCRPRGSQSSYRYVLTRKLGQLDLLKRDRGTVMFLMLNPSTATEEADDPTIRRVVGYAQLWGFSTLVVGNLYALRSTDPRLLLEHPDPVGPENDEAIRRLASSADLIVAAWGAGPGPTLKLHERARRVLDLVGRQVHCLDTTADGNPRHPLYLRASLVPRPYEHRAR